MSDTWSINPAGRQWQLLHIPHYAGQAGEGKGTYTVPPFHETWGQTSRHLQFQVQRYYCSNQYYWSCQGSNTLKQTYVKTRGREYSRWGNMYPVVCWSWLVTSWARWLVEVLKNFQPSWYCIGSLESAMVGILTPWKGANTTNQNVVCCWYGCFVKSQLLNTLSPQWHIPVFLALLQLMLVIINNTTFTLKTFSMWIINYRTSLM